MEYHHVTAMATEAVNLLDCRPGGTYVDGTLGGCGHAQLICEQIAPAGRLIGIDKDADAVAHARKVLAPYGAAVTIIRGNFANMPQLLAEIGVSRVDGILLDLGLSLHQLRASGRGFSFRQDEPLDMRMDDRQDLTAADLVNRLAAAELASIFRDYGQQSHAGRIAARIVAARDRQPIRTSGQLARIVAAALGGRASRAAIHPATKVFMALRIAVNAELDDLKTFLDRALDLLAPGGRLCILAFHSLEDRLVKHRFRKWASACQCPPRLPCTCGGKARVKLLTPKVLRPGKAEIKRNPMARSTRLRAVEKCRDV